MKTKRTSGSIMAGQPTHFPEPTRRFLRGLLVFLLAFGSLIALSARGQTNYPGVPSSKTPRAAVILHDYRSNPARILNLDK